jgi:hypothetical protein
MNFYKSLNKNDWLLVTNHIKFRKGEIMYSRIEKDASSLHRRGIAGDKFELFDLQKGYNSVFVSHIFLEKVLVEITYTHLVNPRKLCEIGMYLLYDCFENDHHEAIISKLIRFLDAELVNTNLANIKNANHFNFNIILLIERLARWLTTMTPTGNVENYQVTIDLLKKLFYINCDYIQVKGNLSPSKKLF